MLSAVVIHGAEQTPRLVSVAETTQVGTGPAADTPPSYGDVNPAPSPLHLPVVLLGQALVTEDLGHTFEPLRVVSIRLCPADPGHLFTPIVHEQGRGGSVCVQRQLTRI